MSIWRRRSTTPTFAAIERAYDAHGVIFFRGQRITPPQQVAFTRRFGEIEFNIFGERWSVPGSPEIVVVSNITEDGRPIGVRRAGENWHSDMCYTARPPRGTMLYALEIPDLFGLPLGDTEFASAAAAWDALPDGAAAAARRTARGVRLHRPQAGLPADAGGDRPQPAGPASDRADASRIPAASACTSCATTAPASRAWSRTEAEAMIAALADHIVKPAFIYRHQWRPGDLLMWDNCTVQHRAIQDYDMPQRRLMHRTTMGGAVPA